MRWSVITSPLINYQLTSFNTSSSYESYVKLHFPRHATHTAYLVFPSSFIPSILAKLPGKALSLSNFVKIIRKKNNPNSAYVNSVVIAITFVCFQTFLSISVN